MAPLQEPEPELLKLAAAALHQRRTPAKLEGPGVALALGGGFSRGFAHLGVLEVLEKEQIPVSAIVGTSIGALLGAAYADGFSPRELCDLGRSVRIRDFLRFQSSGSGDGRGAQKMDLIGRFVRERFHARSLEQLSIPTAIVTTDLDTGSPLVFVRGPLEVAIRATCAFPGLFKPVPYEGRMLADGCIVSPVPTAVAAQMNGSCVLGVAVIANVPSAQVSGDAAPQRDRSRRNSHRYTPEPSWVRQADVLLEPEVRAIDWSDFSRVEEAFAAGAEAMRRALPSVRDLLRRRSQLPTTPGLQSGAERWLVL
jgi:NTE family protein